MVAEFGLRSFETLRDWALWTLDQLGENTPGRRETQRGQPMSACCAYATLLYSDNMTRWSHRQAEVRRALHEAASLRLRIKDTPGSHGHSWGYIDCTNADCAVQPRRYYVNSTPQSQGNEASKIRRFIR
jgi:hypothetical protein